MKLRKILSALFLSVAMFFGLSACKGQDQPQPEPKPEPIQPAEKAVEVVFDTDGGSTIDKITLKEAGKISKPENPTKDGYVFEGWYKNSTKTTLWDFAKDVVSESTTIYAKWAKILTCEEAAKLC